MSEPLGRDRNGTPIFKGDLCDSDHHSGVFVLDKVLPDGRYDGYSPGFPNDAHEFFYKWEIWLVSAVESRKVDVCSL